MNPILTTMGAGRENTYPPPLTPKPRYALQVINEQDTEKTEHSPEDRAAFDNLCRQVVGKPALTLASVEIEAHAENYQTPPVVPDYFGEMENLFDPDELAEAEAIRAEACGELIDEMLLE
jgi:hypothetical protein